MDAHNNVGYRYDTCSQSKIIKAYLQEGIISVLKYEINIKI